MKEIYYISIITVLATFMFIIYFWLKDAINYKIKSLFSSGVGAIYFDKVGNIKLKFLARKKGDVTINDEKKNIDTTIRNFKFLGKNCLCFVENIPTNIDILEGEKKYNGVSNNDIDKLLINHAKEKSIGFLSKIKPYLPYLIAAIVIGAVAAGVAAYLGYKDHILIKNIVRNAGNVITPK